jgi:hypothetical protein
VRILTITLGSSGRVIVSAQEENEATPRLELEGRMPYVESAVQALVTDFLRLDVPP